MQHLPEAVQSAESHMCGDLKAVTVFVLSCGEMVLVVLETITISLAEPLPFPGSVRVLCVARATPSRFPFLGPVLDGGPGREPGLHDSLGPGGRVLVAHQCVQALGACVSQLALYKGSAGQGTLDLRVSCILFRAPTSGSLERTLLPMNGVVYIISIIRPPSFAVRHPCPSFIPAQQRFLALR